MATTRPHDLLWLTSRDALEEIDARWVHSQWRPALPVVVRRDVDPAGRVPVGVRGLRRDQRAAGWVAAAHIVRVVTPEMLRELPSLLDSPFVSQPPVQVAIQLAQQRWPWQWGITGGTGYALATQVPVLHADSDLDLLIRAPQALDRDALADWQRQLSSSRLCRADTQVETPNGGFALAEWLRDGQALLKTDRGPRRVSDPWSMEW
ncbi:Phosphoribosyl-dephospho-CoA transferase [Dickeya dianthicola]|uniref:Malonate decarboxylase holo-ACP synthase n=2 Tax=Dickeya dianthicola TaxID=204039 RepID=A0AAP2CZ30_9GAMM|nr:malonate decarboxylase holo-ACP synthase [Dickeya dianthicola]ATO32521.1 Phosphoribosyl-dephospho-CoA transferase [Dickeya dianthicola RNS04.9]AYC18531.1 Phosphoribosyl-dephospho-CoA transferase [Dickeya dianthicola]MBI0439188.1 malonate decarboxylase holo-ACP synthase [Dickeya dianthicola]MBI0455818.1 malonate decarboxylase holo-ACP synthase [Dickeya dianthicola]MBI0460147.1 malonate decarboxylase holo-ACP synthase [Dickeya dianthicola]